MVVHLAGQTADLGVTEGVELAEGRLIGDTVYRRNEVWSWVDERGQRVEEADRGSVGNCVVIR